MGRFTNLPERLREQAEMVSDGGILELGDSLAISATMRDAALKIEALEREVRSISRKSR
ncbi:hypothetical protein [Tritonibacter mobilis]|uniref:hypothetical protein n=1 Tax=Tritonibacter mobilis TaxID=379347 RepID=UPI0013A60BC7|nr:hypothetical protein [Tritonibacter mobilis]